MVLKPAREHATNNAQTYFVTAKTWESRALFRADPWARLFFQNLLSHRDSYLLHEFVLMPDHFHLLISPSIALERAVQFVKGGFSFRAKRELASNAEIWQRGFSDHRIRDWEDYGLHTQYIHLNPLKKHLCASTEQYSYSSAFPGWKLDPIPQGLKPGNSLETVGGTAKQAAEKLRKYVERSKIGGYKTINRLLRIAPRASWRDLFFAFRYKKSFSAACKAVPFQSHGSEESLTDCGTVEAVPFQNNHERTVSPERHLSNTHK